jgi:AcrR family transcriptional regulator
MTTKAPRRTPQRILEGTLALFNRYGEPNVSTTAIAADLGMSPGNLYYHFPAKDELINALFDRFEHRLREVLSTASAVRDLEEAWFFLHSLFEVAWDYRFVYRDINDLLSKNRRIEQAMQQLIELKVQALQRVLDGLAVGSGLRMDASTRHTTADTMVVLLTYWLSFEYVRNPRQALEPDHAQEALLRGAQHLLALLAPYWPPEQAPAWAALQAAYAVPASS